MHGLTRSLRSLVRVRVCRQAILRPLSAQDVSHAVQFAIRYNLPFSVRSGGHNPEHWSSAGTLVLDLQGLDGVELVSRSRAAGGRTADGTGNTSSAAEGRSAANDPAANAVASGSGSTSSSLQQATFSDSDQEKPQSPATSTLQHSARVAHQANAYGNIHGEQLSSSSSSAIKGKGKRKAGDQDDNAMQERQEEQNNGDGNGRGRGRGPEESMMLHSQSLPVPTSSSVGEVGKSSFSSASPSPSSANKPVGADAADEEGKTPSPSLRSGSDPEIANARLNGTTGPSGDSKSSSETGNNNKRQRMNGHSPLAASSSTTVAGEGLPENNKEEAEGGGGREEEGENPARYIIANTYPPLNLANAGPSILKAAHESLSARQHNDQDVEGASTAFNLHVADTKKEGKDDDDEDGKGKLTFPDPPVPGMIPPFSDSKTEALVNGQFSTSSAAAAAAAAANGTSQMSEAGPGPSSSREILHRNPSSGNVSTMTSAVASSSRGGAAGGHNSNRGDFFGASTDEDDYKLVRFGAGIRAQSLDAQTSLLISSSSSAAVGGEYFVPQACYPVGAAIFTTGGYGFLSRLYGLSMDQVVSYELVLPNESGRIVTLYEDWKTKKGLSREERKEQEELWFVMKGAGTGFAICTSVTAKAYRVGKVLAGNIIL